MQDKLTKHIKEQLQKHQIEPPKMSWNYIYVGLKEESKEQGMLVPWRKKLFFAASIALPFFISLGILWFLSTTDNFPSTAPSSQLTSIYTPVHTKHELEKHSKKEIGLPMDKTHKEKKSTQKNQKKLIVANKKDEEKSERENTNISTRQEEKQKKNAFDSIRNRKISPKQKTFENQFVGKLHKKTKKQKRDITISPYTGISTLTPFKNASLITTAMNSLENNNKIAMVYGSTASIKINDKLRLRSGIGVINIKQETLQVPLAMTSATTEAEKKFNIAPKVNLNADLLTATYATQEGRKKNEILEGRTLHQTLSYELQFIEIPLEMEYSILQKDKFRIATISGLSTLFRNKNTIYIDGKQEFAESTNINKISVAANIGVKFNYQLNPKLSLNLEPQMKYLLNTVTNNNKITPYTLGVNVGLSWSLFP